MKKIIIHSVVIGAILLSLYQYASSLGGVGEQYPRKPVRVVVPFQPGGGSDTFVRVLQKAIGDNDLMSQPLVVVNKPGGGTSIGSSYVRNARNDGYTVLCLHEALLVAKSTGQSPDGPYDYEPVAATGEFGVVVNVPENSKYQTLEALLTEAKENPNEVTFGINFNTPAHFTGIMLENAMPGAKFRFVATGGGAHRLSALMGGHVDAIILSIGEYLRFKENGLKAIAYMGKERSPTMPEVPTAGELGFPVFRSNYHYWWFPKGTDPEIVTYFSGVLEKALQTDYAQKRLGDLQVVPKIIKGEALTDRIDEKMEELDKIEVERGVELPDVSKWTIGTVVVLILAALGQRFLQNRGGRLVEAEEKEERNYAFAAATVGFAVLYVLAMGLGLLSYVWATMIFVIVSGLLLTRFDRGKWLYLVEVAFLMSFGLRYVFTHVFTIDLP